MYIKVRRAEEAEARKKAEANRPPPPSVAAGGAGTGTGASAGKGKAVVTLHEKVRRFYFHYNKVKLDKEPGFVEAVVNHYGTKLVELNGALRKQYGEDLDR